MKKKNDHKHKHIYEKEDKKGKTINNKKSRLMW